eukprot:2412290-Rhodomonas_salina.2
MTVTVTVTNTNTNEQKQNKHTQTHRGREGGAQLAESPVLFLQLQQPLLPLLVQRRRRGRQTLQAPRVDRGCEDWSSGAVEQWSREADMRNANAERKGHGSEKEASKLTTKG